MVVITRLDRATPHSRAFVVDRERNAGCSAFAEYDGQPRGGAMHARATERLIMVVLLLTATETAPSANA
jgi:hypothetical protein